MKSNCIITGCVALLIGATPMAFGQESPVADKRDAASGQPQRIVGCETRQDPRVRIRARSIIERGSIVRASEGVDLRQGKKHLTANYVEWNVDQETGFLRGATFTTCAGTKPDYHITAREITLLPNDRLRARGVGLYLGGTRVLGLPWFKMQLGGRTATRNVFPRPGYDKIDGYTLSQDFRFIDEDNLRANADLRLTSGNGVQGQIYSVAGIDGKIIDLPGRYLSFESMRSEALDLPPLSDPECTVIAGPDPRAARLRGYGTFTLKQRTYDILNNRLVVYRQPELGLTYVAHQLDFSKAHLDPRLQIYPEVSASWGRFKESPGQEEHFRTRSRISGQAAFNPFSLGSNTAIQPLVSYAWSGYSNGDNYRVLAYGVDASHLWGNGSIASARYIGRSQSGMTPFQFDNVHIKHELQTALQLQMRKHLAGVVIGYDFDRGNVYDWEVMYGWRSDCLQASVRYNQLYNRLSFDVGLINL